MFERKKQFFLHFNFCRCFFIHKCFFIPVTNKGKDKHINEWIYKSVWSNIYLRWQTELRKNRTFSKCYLNARNHIIYICFAGYLRHKVFSLPEIKLPKSWFSVRFGVRLQCFSVVFVSSHRLPHTPSPITCAKATSEMGDYNILF